MKKNAWFGAALIVAFIAAGCGDGGSTSPPQDGGGIDARPQLDARPQTDVYVPPQQDAVATDGPEGFESAKDITVDADYVSGVLANPATSKNYYKFQGTAGQRIVVATQAKSGLTDPFDPTALDLVVTIYDENETAIAEQDDPWPRTSNDPRLFTVLPTAGLYYITVEDCNSAFGSTNCYPPIDITNKNYQVAVFNVESLGPPTPIVESATDQDGTTDNAIPITFTSAGTVDGGVGGNVYQNNVIAGGLQSGTDVDVYSLTVPGDYSLMPNYRATAVFYLQTPGLENGDGSTARIRAWLVDAADTSGKHLAEVDQANYADTNSDTNSPAEMIVPITLDSQYFLFVENREGAEGARDFYFVMRADDNYFGPTETDDTNNNTLETAEAMPTQADTDGSVWFGVNGDIGVAGTDVDYYSITVGVGLTTASVSCGAQRIGSGLRGFTFSLLQSDGTAISGGSATESADADFRVTNIALPTGATSVILKLEATSQDDNVTSTYYRCQVHLL